MNRSRPFNGILVGLVPGLLWLWLFAHLRDHWTLNSQYNYGWAVPFLAAFLFYVRWKEPPPSTDIVAGDSRRARALLLKIFLLLPLLPLRVIEEANRDWRLLGWVLGLIVAGYSFVSLWEIGGRRWVNHFAFPICFPLVAVPWPVQIENLVVQNLARGVAAGAVEIAGWIGIGAYQLGNVIELPNGFVGVDDACSGVKTLQAGIMVTFFLGELLRLPLQKRSLLVAAGCAWVFLCNIGRATTLVILAAKHGTGAIDEWHDMVGTVVLVVGMAGVLGLALFLQKRLSVESAAAASDYDSDRSGGSRHGSLGEAVTMLLWLAFVFCATEFWYRSHERDLIARPAWSARWPQENNMLRLLEIPEATGAILHYDEATSATWQTSGGVKWWGFFAHWRPQRAALQLVRSHSPEICLPAAGRTFKRELPEISLKTNDVDLRFRCYEFEQLDRPLFVFVAIQEDKTRAGNTALEFSARGRLQAAWNGQRNLGQRLLEIAVIGFNDFSHAREALLRAAEDIVG